MVERSPTWELRIVHASNERREVRKMVGGELELNKSALPPSLPSSTRREELTIVHLSDPVRKDREL